MTHSSHGDTHTVIDRNGGGAGLLVGLAIVVVLAVVALAVLWSAPWDDDNDGVDTTPGISDDVVPGDGDDVVPGDGGDVVPDGGSGEPDVVPDGQ